MEVDNMAKDQVQPIFILPEGSTRTSGAIVLYANMCSMYPIILRFEPGYLRGLMLSVSKFFTLLSQFRWHLQIDTIHYEK